MFTEPSQIEKIKNTHVHTASVPRFEWMQRRWSLGDSGLIGQVDLEGSIHKLRTTPSAAPPSASKLWVPVGKFLLMMSTRKRLLASQLVSLDQSNRSF